MRTAPRVQTKLRPLTANLITLAVFCLALLPAFGACAASITAHVTETTGNALPDTVIYAIPVSGKAPLKTAPRAVIDQINREFDPLVSVMQTGAVVSFPNKDNIRHHVYSFSPAKKFELRLYSGTQAPPITFDTPGLVTLGCNIHDHMIAYALVVDTPWFGKSDAAGKAALDGLPAGDYDLHAWHHRQASTTAFSQRISVKSAGSNEVPIKIDLKAGKPVLHRH